HLAIAGAIPSTGPPVVTLGTTSGRLLFSGADVRWLAGMPPVTAVAGTAVFSRNDWQVRGAGGEVGGLGGVRSLNTGAPRGGAPGILVDTTARGPLSKVLALLDRPQLRSGSAIPFAPGDISGGATARVLLDIPLEHGTVNVRGSGDLRSVTLRRAFRGRNMAAPRLRVEMDSPRFEMTGPVSIGRAQFQLRWRDAPGTSSGRRVIDLKGRLDSAGRKALGVDLAPWLDGPVDVQARLRPRGEGVTAMNLDVDLLPASLDLPLLAMVKEPGV